MSGDFIIDFWQSYSSKYDGSMSVIIQNIKLTKQIHSFPMTTKTSVALAALLIQHLSATECQLPIVVNYSFPVSYPSLNLANRIYGDGSRSDESTAKIKPFTLHSCSVM